MTRLPSITGRKLIAALKRMGFQVVRIKGSHHFMQHPDGRVTLVPVHSGEDIGRGLLAKILADAEVAEVEFRRFL